MEGSNREGTPGDGPSRADPVSSRNVLSPLGKPWHDPPVSDTSTKFCRECGQIMWLVDLPGLGTVRQCLSCRQSVDAQERTYIWYKPVSAESRAISKERRYQGRVPCPRCGRSMWVIEVPNFGSRQQCYDCRITVVEGAVLEWRGGRG